MKSILRFEAELLIIGIEVLVGRQLGDGNYQVYK
jgi:hypothetical protein